MMKLFKRACGIMILCIVSANMLFGQEGGKLVLSGKFGNAFLALENKEGKNGNTWWLKEDASGETELEIPGKFAGKRMYLHLEGGKMTQLIVPPGGRVVLEFLVGKAFVFSGNNEKINNYLRDWSEAVFNSVDNIYTCCFALLPLFTKKVPSPGEIFAAGNLSKIVNGLDVEKKRLIAAGIQDSCFVREQEVYIRYQQIYSRLRNMVYALELDDDLIPESEWQFFKSLSFDDSDMRLFPFACSLIGTYFVVEQRVWQRNTDYREDLYACALRIGDVRLRENYIIDRLKSLVNHKMIYSGKEIIASVEPLLVSKNARLQLNHFREDFSRLEAMFPGKGEVISDGELVDAEGNIHSLNKFRGKYVFVDFWATWCGACCQMTPHVKELARELAGKNIEFVFISIDKFALKNNVFQYASEHGTLQNTYIVKDKKEWDERYLLRSIPRFMLVDPEGRIISTNFLWPNNELLLPHLRKLLDTSKAR